jgi:hypothetical protein
MEESLHWFVSTGKTQRDFATWVMNTQKGMSEAQVTKVAADLKSPYSYKMQLILNGGGN